MNKILCVDDDNTLLKESQRQLQDLNLQMVCVLITDVKFGCTQVLYRFENREKRTHILALPVA
jgi:hypothetical protein